MKNDYANKTNLYSNSSAAKATPRRRKPTPKGKSSYGQAHSSDKKPVKYGRWVVLTVVVIAALVVFGMMAWQKLHHAINHGVSVSSTTQISEAGSSSSQGSASPKEESAQVDSASPAAQATSEKQSEADHQADSQQNVQKIKMPPQPTFEFYNKLPNQKVAVEAETAVTSDRSQTQSDKQFMVQVASYKDNAKVQAMVSRLEKIGLKPQSDQTDSGWYRVDIGPVDSVRAGDVIRHKLQANGINGSIIRQVQ